MKIFSLSLVSLIIVFGFSDYSPSKEEKDKKHVVLLGASIGKAWNLPAFSERKGVQDYVFEYVHGGGFDKTAALKRIVSRQENKPDAIILKECASYFPGDLQHYQSLMKVWLDLCEQEEVILILTTVVPVTRLHSFKKILIDIIKGRDPLRNGNPFNNNRNQGILEYNDWVQLYAEKKGLTVLDLERAVRYSENNRYLREDLAKIDGLHLNSIAYEFLDRIVLPTLNKVNWENKKKD